MINLGDVIRVKNRGRAVNGANGWRGVHGMKPCPGFKPENGSLYKVVVSIPHPFSRLMCICGIEDRVGNQFIIYSDAVEKTNVKF